MAFDRSKFKATTSKTLKQKDEETQNLVSNKPNQADYINIPAKDRNGKKIDGTYTVRIYPFHPDGGGDTFCEVKGVHWLKVMSPKRDKDGKIQKDDKGNEIKELRPKPVFNSKIHGGTPKDIVEEYIAFAEKVAKENFPTSLDKQKDFLAPIKGGFGTKFDGLLVRQTWVMYADLIGDDGKKTFGRLEVGRAVKQRLNAIAASESPNDPLGTDPFTDIVDGRAVKITYDGNAKKSQDYYTTEIDSTFDKVTKMIKLYPLSDEDLEKFLTYPSLASQFKNVYSKKDFNLAIEGLKNFDDEFKLGIFGYEAFLDIAEEIEAYYPDVENPTDGEGQEEEEVEEMKPVAKQPTKAKPIAKKPVVEEEEEIEEEEIAEEGDEFSEMSRNDLKIYIRDNKTGIVVTPKMSDEDVRNKLREWVNADLNPEVEPEPAKAPKADPNEVKGDLPWEKEEEAPKAESKGMSAADRVAAMRNKLKK